MRVSSKKDYSVREMKQKTIDVMEELCRSIGSTTKNLKQINDLDIEGANFLFACHAKGVREFCKRKRIHVSFRETGQYTLERIKEGKPCKGHDILDKSIKKDAKDKWTYHSFDQRVLDKYRGYIGYSHDTARKTLDGLWGLKEEGTKYRSLQYSLEKVADPMKKDKVQLFTGDYDLHDLLKDKKRVLADNPDEKYILSALSDSMLKYKSNDPRYVPRKKQVMRTSDAGRRYESPYSLIRHGAQTSFISYLLLGKSYTELKNFTDRGVPYRGTIYDEVSSRKIDPDKKIKTLAMIDDPIVIFDSTGKSYLLDSVPKVYYYYKKEGLIDQLPFYYFFPYIITKTDDSSPNLSEMFKSFYKNVLYPLLKFRQEQEKRWRKEHPTR